MLTGGLSSHTNEYCPISILYAVFSELHADLFSLALLVI